MMERPGGGGTSVHVPALAMLSISLSMARLHAARSSLLMAAL
jgi:hypothetical protein